MKNILKYIFILAAIAGLSSCLDDENNYDYKKLNGLDGEITGMKKEYSLSYAEELTITPSFKFTIDKENPDVSYEWRLDGNLLVDEVKPSCSFRFERGGVHEVTYSVVDNKSGVKFSKSCTINVRSPFTRGWLVLSEGSGQESVLSVVGARTVIYEMPVTSPDGTQTGVVERDSLVYDQVVKNVLSGLGRNPKGLFLNAGYVSEYGEIYEISDEVGVKQERWAELNGNTLERSVYTDQEFQGDFPAAGFQPQDIAMTYSSKAVLNADGYIYWAVNTFANDYHTCTYVSIPLGKDRKFKGVYPSYRMNRYHCAIPALTQENEIVGLMDSALPYSFENPLLRESTINSQIFSVKKERYVSEDEDPDYKLGDWELISMMPASHVVPEEYLPYQDVRPGWVTILHKGGQYELFYFQWNISDSSRRPGIYNDYSSRLSLNGLSGYTDMAVFNNKQYVVIAEGANLWYFQYGMNEQAVLKKLHTFNSPIKALSANDITHRHSEFGNPAVGWQPEHNGQLGVALEDGTFSIYEVWETKEKGQKLSTEVSINQLFPDPKTTEPIDNKFGKMVDMIYKYGSIREFGDFTH